MKKQPPRLAPRVREFLDYLWRHPMCPAVPHGDIPENLRGAMAWCIRQRPPWVRIIGVGNVPCVELLAPGASRLQDEGLWDDPQTEKAPDDREWILVTRALARLPFKSLKALYKFAEENPDRLHLKSGKGRRRLAKAADVLALEEECSRKAFDALGTPAADNLPSFAEGLEKLGERLRQTKRTKRK